MLSSRRGFTLVELMIVTVIVGILAMVAMPLFTSTKEEAYVATMKSDLRNVTVAQESYLADNQVYADEISALDFEPSDAVEIAIELADEDERGWTAEASHRNTPITCAIFVGTLDPVGPAEEEGVPACTGRE